MHNEYVQFGCGFAAPSTWRNFDASPTLRFERLPVVGRLYTKNGRRFPENVEYGDILLGLPVPTGSCGSRQRWMWDFKSLAYELQQAGFSRVRRCEAGDAADPVFADVEDPRRFQYALGIECAKE